AEPVDRRLRHRLRRGFVGDVGVQTDRLAIGPHDTLRHLFGGRTVDVGSDDLGAGSRELLGIDLADALAAAGDDGDAAFEIETGIACHVRYSITSADSSGQRRSWPPRR